jgi:glycosyltransferase involved in cell wall biosynthesis
MRRADRGSRAVVVNAAAIRSIVEREGVHAERIAFIPNMLDVEEFDRLAAGPLPSGMKLPAGELVGMVARLDPEKDGATFLRAAAAVCAQVSGVGFVLAGDGPQRPGLERLATEMGLGDRVAFLGDVTCVPALLRRLAIGVLVPKANEGLSNTLLEYMAARLPIVATNCGGNSEVVGEGHNGLLTPCGDAEAVASAVLRLVRDPEQRARFGADGRSRVEAQHRPEVVAAQFLRLYAAVAAPRIDA